MLRRLILILSLITAFGLGQQGVAVHAISHLADEQSEQHKNAPAQACEKCTVYAQLGSAAGVEYTLFLLDSEQQQSAFEHVIHRASQHTSQYAARAPPQLT